MSTRGSAIIGGERYWMGSDAYPSFAKSTLLYAVKRASTPSGVVRVANDKAGFTWLTKMSRGERGGYPFESYRWKVNLKTKQVYLDKEYMKSFDRQHKRFMKNLREGKGKYAKLLKGGKL
jgi:hypothetical protein